MQTVWVTGASGMLGRAVLREFGVHAPAWRTVGTAHSRARDAVRRVDLCDARARAAFLEAVRPDIVLHTAAERRPDAMERDPGAAQRLNVAVPGELAGWCRVHGAWLIHLSTDYVFDGTQPPYAPTARPCPLNAYGVSKRDAEDAVRGQSADAAILRVPILYGEVETLAESAVTALAVVLRQMIEHRAAEPSFGGVMHWSGDTGGNSYPPGDRCGGAYRRGRGRRILMISVPSG